MKITIDGITRPTTADIDITVTDDKGLQHRGVCSVFRGCDGCWHVKGRSLEDWAYATLVNFIDAHTARAEAIAELEAQPCAAMNESEEL